jgi:hypothetical protein
MTRTPIGRAAVLFSILFLGTYRAYSQGYAIVQQAKVSVSKALEGKVSVGPEKYPVAGATVVLLKSDWQAVLANTHSDAKGLFHFLNPPRQKLYYLQLSAPGIDPYRLRVRIEKGSSRQLDINMVIAE